MKKSNFIFLGLLALLVVTIFTSCGGNDPKALAKQTYDLGLQAVGALLNPAKSRELEKKAEAIQNKVVKLSAKDKAIYQEELLRLAGGDLNSVLNAASKLIDNTSIEDLQKTMDTANQAVDFLKSLGK